MSDLEFLSGHELVVYSETHCPDCVRLKQWMNRRGVKARELLITDDAEAAERLERETGKMAVPFILVDGTRWVRGYHKELPTRFDPKLFVVELEAAIADLPKH